MTRYQRSGATGAARTATLDRAVPTASAAACVVTATILIGNGPDAVAANPRTGDVYVASQWANTVSVISGQTNTVTATIPVGNGPVGVAVNPLTGTVYTANIGDDTVSVISG